MPDFDTLVTIFWATIFFYIVGDNKLVWIGLLIFWCLITSVYCFFHEMKIDMGLWFLNALLWVNSYRKKLKQENGKKSS